MGGSTEKIYPPPVSTLASPKSSRPSTVLCSSKMASGACSSHSRYSTRSSASASVTRKVMSPASTFTCSGSVCSVISSGFAFSTSCQPKYRTAATAVAHSSRAAAASGSTRRRMLGVPFGSGTADSSIISAGASPSSSHSSSRFIA